MKSTSAYRLVFPVGLLLLVFCSTGLAMLKCHKCTWTKNDCKTTQQCDANVDACMTVTRQDGMSLRQCVAYSKCNTEAVRQDLGITGNINLQCCQTDLCNKGFAGLPASGLILFLAAALLVFFS